MQRWEYQFVDVGGFASGMMKKSDIRIMNRLGLEGWEAVAIYANDRHQIGSGGAVLFKRPLPANTPAPTPPPPAAGAKPVEMPSTPPPPTNQNDGQTDSMDE